VPSIDEVYCKFGEAAEAAQLLETQIGTLLFEHGIINSTFFIEQNIQSASDLMNKINRQTLGQLLKGLIKTQPAADIEALLSNALQERNRLLHSFYRQHNFRRNTEEGRALMLADIEFIHLVLIDAYKAVM